MSSRPLVLVSGLTLGDYLLWNWALAGNHLVFALISGFSLVPLAAVCLLQLALALARLIGYVRRLPARPSSTAAQGHGRTNSRAAASTARPHQSSRKLAA